MIIKDLFKTIRDEKPNSFDDETLMRWVNEVEGEVQEQLAESDIAPYEKSDVYEELLAPFPYDRLYVSYLKAKIDYALEEYSSFENNQAQHVQDFRDFVDWVIRSGNSKQDYPTRFINVI